MSKTYTTEQVIEMLEGMIVRGNPSEYYEDVIRATINKLKDLNHE